MRAAGGLIAFFGCLGTGFMFVEIGCMQWLNLYLGHPMYSLMVVLAGLLLFAGCGSLLAGRMARPVLAKLRLGMLGTAVLIPLWLLAMKFALPPTEHWVLGGPDRGGSAVTAAAGALDGHSLRQQPAPSGRS